MSRHHNNQWKGARDLSLCHDNVVIRNIRGHPFEDAVAMADVAVSKLMSRHQDRQLNTTRYKVGCHDMIMMSRHHKQTNETTVGSAQCQDIKNDQSQLH